MKIFLAGNFPLMKDKELERKMRDIVCQHTDSYRRLISYYYEKDIQNLLDLREEELNEG